MIGTAPQVCVIAVVGDPLHSSRSATRRRAGIVTTKAQGLEATSAPVALQAQALCSTERRAERL